MIKWRYGSIKFNNTKNYKLQNKWLTIKNNIENRKCEIIKDKK